MSMDQNASAIIAVFAHYGFRKTAMEDVAKAAGKSRQALYNRFGSKDAVFLLVTAWGFALDVQVIYKNKIRIGI